MPTPPRDVVVFNAACPRCGAFALWQEERGDTRLFIHISCGSCPLPGGA